MTKIETVQHISDLDRIKEVYDKCGINYAIASKGNGYNVLFFISDRDTEEDIEYQIDQIVNYGRYPDKFMEFYNGKVASY